MNEFVLFVPLISIVVGLALGFVLGSLSRRDD